MNYQDEKVNTKADSTTMSTDSSYAADLFFKLSPKEREHIFLLILDLIKK